MHRSFRPFMQNKMNKKTRIQANDKLCSECCIQFLIFKTLIDSKESLIISNKSNSFLFTIASNLLSLIFFFAMANTSSIPLNYGL